MTSHEYITSEDDMTMAEKIAKKLQEVLAVRTSQKELDPRIFKLCLKDDGDYDLPYLHYGFLIPQNVLKPYMINNNIDFIRDDSEMWSEEYHQPEAQAAVEDFLKNKCGGFKVSLVYPLEEDFSHFCLSVNDTVQLLHAFDKRWSKHVAPVLKTLREEFALGDQAPMWWWDSLCDTGYVCPIPDFNPPRMNKEYKRSMRPRFYDEKDLDSDSDSESDTEAER